MKKNFDNPFGVKWKNGNLKSMAALLDAAVFPGTQGGPLEHVIAAKAVAFGEALSDGFENYVYRVKENASVMASEIIARGYKIISGGTDNHSMLIDLRSKGVNGKDAEIALGKTDITVNKNMVPFDTESPFVTSGIRVGTAAITSRGVSKDEIPIIVDYIDQTLTCKDNDRELTLIKEKVKTLMQEKPLFTW